MTIPAICFYICKIFAGSPPHQNFKSCFSCMIKKEGEELLLKRLMAAEPSMGNLTLRPSTLHEMHQLQLIKHGRYPIHHLQLEIWLPQDIIVSLAAQEHPIENPWHFPTCTICPQLIQSKSNLSLSFRDMFKEMIRMIYVKVRAYNAKARVFPNNWTSY